MNRRKLLGLLGIPFLTALGGGAYAAFRRGKNPYYDGPVTANFNGIRFTDGRPVTKGFKEFLQWQMQGGREVWPDSFAALTPDKPPARVDGLRAVHLGHASFLYQTGGLNILVDPVLSQRASPFQFAGPKRVNPPGVAFDDLPKIDVILITHNHYDHLDMNTISRVFARDGAKVIAPLGNDTIINAADSSIGATAHDWGTRLPLNDKVAVTLEPSYHWSARGALDRRMALWCAFVVETPKGKIYHIGDTGYHDGAFFRAVKEKHGPILLATLPIGAFEPRWFMSDNHMNPQEAVQVMLDCGAQHALGHHWGTFQLTNEGVERPRHELASALMALSIAEERFRPARPGMVWEA